MFSKRSMILKYYFVQRCIFVRKICCLFVQSRWSSIGAFDLIIILSCCILLCSQFHFFCSEKEKKETEIIAFNIWARLYCHSDAWCLAKNWILMEFLTMITVIFDLFHVAWVQWVVLFRSFFFWFVLEMIKQWTDIGHCQCSMYLAKYRNNWSAKFMRSMNEVSSKQPKIEWRIIEPK